MHPSPLLRRSFGSTRDWQGKAHVRGVFVIAIWHRSLATVVETLLAGHVAFFFAILIGLGGTQHSWASPSD